MAFCIEVFRNSALNPFLNCILQCLNFVFFFLQKSKPGSNNFARIFVTSFQDSVFNKIFKVISQ